MPDAHKPVRDSLIHPGDKLSVDVSPDDVETALTVILLKSGSSADREARVIAPEPGDFGGTHSVTRSESVHADDTPAADDDRERPAITRKSEDSDRPAAAAPRDSTADVIREARSAAYAFSEDLHNFLVQVTTRSSRSRSVDSWNAIDVVTADARRTAAHGPQASSSAIR